MDPISAGMAALQVGTSLFGLFSNRNSGRVNPGMAAAYNQLDIQNSQLEQQRMNIDAMRRKRDIIRQAQVATAQAENSAANSGALKSSGIEGARASISGQAGTNLQGVEWNQEIGNLIASNQQQQSLLRYQMDGQGRQRTNYGAAVGSLLGDTGDELTRMMKWGLNIRD